MSTFDIHVKRTRDGCPYISIKEHFDVTPKYKFSGWKSGLIQKDEILSVAQDLREVVGILDKIYLEG